MSEDGWISFADRIKDMIKVGGEGASASEVEAALIAEPSVREVAVVARPGKTYGEVAVAFVVLREADLVDCERTIAALMQPCQSKLAKFKVPREIIAVPDLPKIGNNKINRPALREQAKAKSPQTTG